MRMQWKFGLFSLLVGTADIVGIACADRVSAQDASTAEPAPVATPAAEPAAVPPPAAQAPADQPVAAPAANDGASADNLLMSADELAALGLDAKTGSLDLGLKVSGFADVGFGTILAGQDSYWRASGTVPPNSSFWVGNFNIYVSKELTSWLRTMGEVRFSYLPNGSSAFGIQGRTNTTAYDYTDFGRATRWGSIIMQRLYIEASPLPWLSVRAGQFLTPYGVWNVDHGSPVFIPVRRPWSVGVGWIPERQTGLEVFGRIERGDSSVGYHLTLSNGTGPISEYADLDENKAIGGRLYWEYRGLGWLRVGASGYYGRDTDALRSAAISPTGDYKSTQSIASQFDALTFAGDVTWDLGGLHVQTEWIVNQRAYTQKGRVQVQTLRGRMMIPSDQVSWGGYGLIGYRLPWLGIMPFAMGERVIGDLEYLRMKLYTIEFGLNVRPVDSLVLKASFEHVAFDDDSVDPLNSIMTQIAWAF